MCAVVRIVMGVDVSEEQLYKGKGTAAAYTARHYIYTLLHDCCGWSYRQIATCCGVSKRKVINATSKVRVLREIDERHKIIAHDLRQLGYEI